MLHEWQKELGKRVPPDMPGYDFVRCVPVFIPYRNFGLSILEHKTQSVSLIQSCVMEAIDSGICDMNNLAEMFGINERVMVEIVSQMESDGMVFTTSNQATLTGKGRKILDSGRKDRIVRTHMTDLYMNRITGEISANPPSWRYKEPDWNQIYLEEPCPFDLNVVNENFETLKRIYEETSVGRTVFGREDLTETELYRIIGVSYANLLYKREYCFTYLNQQDHSWAFRFESGLEVYEDTLQKQFKEDQLGARRLMNQPMLQQSPDEPDFSPIFPEELISAFRFFGDKRQRTDVIETAFFKDRPLLPREIHDTLANCTSYKPESIYLSLPKMDDFLSDAVNYGLMNSGARRISICCQPQDRSAKRTLDRLKRLQKADSPTLGLSTGENSSYIRILLGTKCAIEAGYVPYKGPYNRSVYRLCGKISFRSDRIQQLWEESDWKESLQLYSSEQGG